MGFEEAIDQFRRRVAEILADHVAAVQEDYNARLRQYRVDLGRWITDLYRTPLGETWRIDFNHFLDAQESLGYVMRPDQRRKGENWIERRAIQHGLLPRTRAAAAPALTRNQASENVAAEPSGPGSRPPSGDTNHSQDPLSGREIDTAATLEYNRERRHDAQVGRGISPHPTGFLDGGKNLSLYGNNDPTRKTDSNGAAHELKLHTQLMNTANSWLRNGYGLAGTLLINFLSRKGAVPGEVIDFSQYSDKVSGDSQFMQAAGNYFGGIAVVYASRDRTVTLKLDGKRVLQNNSAFDVRWYNGELFYAFLGARIGHNRAVLVIDPIATNGDIRWKVDGTMELEDSYTFPNVGLRPWSADYAAAMAIEAPPFKYAKFTVYMEWSATFSRTERVVGVE